MSDSYLRLECLKLAGGNLQTAACFLDFITGKENADAMREATRDEEAAKAPQGEVDRHAAAFDALLKESEPTGAP